MKRFYTLSICLLTTFINAEAQTVMDSAALQSGYVNDVYYSIPAHAKYPTPSDWDLALSAQPTLFPNQTLQGAATRFNGGRGVRVYKINNVDASQFDNALSSADSANWMPLVDSPESWDLGALYATHSATDYFDYGWGYYDQSVHNVVGDSVYAIRTLNGTWKKMLINKLSYDTAWFLTVADLDNNNYQTMEINKQAAAGKNFVYLNLNSASVMDKEPAAWDMMFTRYLEMLPAGPGGQLVPYPVNGVLTNKGVTVSKAYPVDVNAAVYNTGMSMSDNINAIGYDWKAYNFTTNQYEIVDSLVYFVKAQDNVIYKLRFTAYHPANAESVFQISEALTSVETVRNASNVILFPNPATDRLAVIDFDATANEQYRISDATGKSVGTGYLLPSQQHAIDLSGMSNGMYIIQIVKNKTVETKSFVVNR